jgi:hypothetical protein
MQRDDQPIPSYPSAANDTPSEESANQTPDIDGASEQRLIRTRAARPNAPRLEPALEAILDRAYAAERQTAAACCAQAKADARLWRAEVAWRRVASFQGDGIPGDLSEEALGRCYAQLIVQLGSVLKTDGWQPRVETVQPGPDAKAYALAILKAAMDGKVDVVEAMISTHSIGTLFNLGLTADDWLRDGLRDEVLNGRPCPEARFAGAGSALRSADDPAGGASAAARNRRQRVAIRSVRDRTLETRDRWIYQKCAKGVAYKTIKTELSMLCQKKGWRKINSIQGIRSAARSYAQRHGLPMPASRQNL